MGTYNPKTRLYRSVKILVLGVEEREAEKLGTDVTELDEYLEDTLFDFKETQEVWRDGVKDGPGIEPRTVVVFYNGRNVTLHETFEDVAVAFEAYRIYDDVRSRFGNN